MTGKVVGDGPFDRFADLVLALIKSGEKIEAGGILDQPADYQEWASELSAGLLMYREREDRRRRLG